MSSPMMRALRNVGVLCLVILAGGCGGGANEYYLLTPAGPAPRGGGIGVGVGPITVAEYLDRSNLVFQTGGQRLEVAEGHHWAGDLRRSIASVMASNLGRELRTGNVRTYPWDRDDELRYQVVIDVRQLHGTAAGGAMLEASWRVYALPGSKLLVSRGTTVQEALGADGFEALAAAESRLFMQLAREIAGALR
jgi:uncharacterized lipoprotein YmbA